MCRRVWNWHYWMKNQKLCLTASGRCLSEEAEIYFYSRFASIVLGHWVVRTLWSLISSLGVACFYERGGSRRGWDAFARPNVRYEACIEAKGCFEGLLLLRRWCATRIILSDEAACINRRERETYLPRAGFSCNIMRVRGSLLFVRV